MEQVSSLKTGIKYKNTPIGKIPVDWEAVILSQIAEINMGQSPPSKDCNEQGDGLPFYQGNAEFGSKYPSPQKWCKRPKKLADEGDILISVRAPVGEINIAPHKCCIGRGIAAVQAKDIHDKFLYQYMLLYRKNLQKMAQGSTFEAINRKELAELLTLLPPFPEQKKIAEILTTVDDAIEKTAQVIEKIKELKKGLIEGLLTRGIGHKKFKKTEIGEIPEDWKIVLLGDIAKIERGRFSFRPRNSPQFYGGDTPFVQTADIVNSNGRIRNYSQTLNKLGVSISKIFPKKTILITIAANIGYTGILEFDSACPDSLIGIRPNENISTTYLHYYLSGQQKKMDAIAPQCAQKNINIQILKSWNILLPPMEEQKQIGNILLTADNEIEKESDHKEELETLKKGLMQVLLTGKIRVAV